MTTLKAHETNINVAENGQIVTVHPANPAVVERVLSADESSPDGRSQFLWLRLPNGDLLLGVYPQGQTYFDVEDDAAYDGPQEDILWCEQCGGRPLMVHTEHAGLCCHCAAATIDEKL